MAGIVAWTTPKRWKPSSQRESTAAIRQTDRDLTLNLQGPTPATPVRFHTVWFDYGPPAQLCPEDSFSDLRT